MNKKQILLISVAVLATVLLFAVGSTVAPAKRNQTITPEAANAALMDIQSLEKQVIATLSPERQQYLAGLDAQVKRGDIKTQAIQASKALAHFYHDSVPTPPLHYYYLADAAKLDNTEKSLTFAAHSILGYIPYAHNSDEQKWLANLGREIFEKALVINANNDSTIIGIGGCLMYGATDSENGGPMQGIVKVRDIAEKDSTNMYAQYMLGVGGVISGQLDKALVRFEKVAAAQPENVEVLFKLAELSENLNNKDAAIKWYQVIMNKVQRDDLKLDIANRIKTLQTSSDAPVGK